MVGATPEFGGGEKAAGFEFPAGATVAPQFGQNATPDGSS